MYLRLKQLAQWVTSWEPCILFVAAPALLFPSAGRSWVLLILPILWLCAYVASSHSVPRTPFDLPILGLLLMVGVSAVVTPDIQFSLPKIAGVLLGVAAYYAIVRRIHTAREQQLAILLLILSGAGLATVGLFGTRWTDKVAILSQITDHLPPAVRGLPGAEDGFQPNSVGGGLVLFIPLQISLLAASLKDRDHRPWFRRSAGSLSMQAGLLLGTCGVLALTESRGAWLGLIIGLVVLLAWQGPLFRRGLVLVLAITGCLLLIPGIRSGLAQRLQPLALGLGHDFVQRQDIWLRGIYAIQDFPLTGTGMNMFRRLMPILYPTPLFDPGLDVAHAHNQFLQVGLDVGLPGLTAYIALWLSAIFLLSDTAVRFGPGGQEAATAHGVLAGLAAFGVFGIADAIPLGAKVGLAFWLVLAVAVVNTSGASRITVNDTAPIT